MSAVDDASETALRIVTDPSHGGRWTSLHAHGREWLWHRHEPRRAAVRPEDPFADAGGLEECLPTVRGVPDHGDAWSRPWRGGSGRESVETDRFRLTRRIRTNGSTATVDYTLAAEPGYRFLWAAHALLDLSPSARIDIPAGTPARLYPDEGAEWIPGRWPRIGGTPLNRLGPDDGSAVGAVVATSRVGVVDGRDHLLMALEADGQPLSVALWRNLGGFPRQAPYRSIGVEPMLGRVFDLAAAGPDEAATVPAGGQLRWRLSITATRITEPPVFPVVP